MTYIQVSFSLKVDFFSGFKTGHSGHPQTSRPAILVDFSGVLQLKNTILGCIGTQEMSILSFKKWVLPVLMQMKMKSSPEALLREFLKSNTISSLRNSK